MVVRDSIAEKDCIIVSVSLHAQSAMSKSQSGLKTVCKANQPQCHKVLEGSSPLYSSCAKGQTLVKEKDSS